MKLISLKFPDDPIFFEGNDNLFVIVPTLSVISVGGQHIESLNFQLGIRSKNGGSWKYIEGSRVTKENVKLFGPDFPGDIDFPMIYRKKIEAESLPATD